MLTQNYRQVLDFQEASHMKKILQRQTIDEFVSETLD
jgi:hypothetical protein